MSLRSFAPLFLIFASSLPAASSRPAGASRLDRLLPPPMPAVYDVPKNARDPFSLPGVHWNTPEKPAAANPTASLTAGRIEAALQVQLVSANVRGDAVAIVNGVLVQVGGKLPLTIAGRKIDLVCLRIAPDPPKVTFKWKDMVLSVGRRKEPHKGDGK